MLSQAITPIVIQESSQFISGQMKTISDRSISVTMAELKKLSCVRLGTIQLSKAKNQIKGYLARGYENHESLMLSLGRSMLVFNRIDSMEDTCKKIDAVTAGELLETANDIFDTEKLSILIYK